MTVANWATLGPLRRRSRGPLSGRLTRSNPDHGVVDVGQAEVAAGVAISELLVVEAHQVQDRGVQIVDMNRLLGGFEAELVGGAVNVPPRRRRRPATS